MVHEYKITSRVPPPPISSQGPHSYFNDGGKGGPTEVHTLYQKKSQLQYLMSTQCNPKNPTLTELHLLLCFFHKPKKSLCHSYMQNSLLAKISDPQKSLGPPPPPPPPTSISKVCEWGPWALHTVSSGGYFVFK